MLRSSPAGLAAKYEHVEKTLAEAVDMARAQQDSDKLKFKIVLPIVRASYGMLELACALYPGPTADLVPQLQLPGEQDFIIVCLAPEDRRKDVMTPPMESLLNLTEPKKMEKIVSELPETDHRFVETIFFATGVAMNAAKALHDRAMTTYSSWDGKPR
ncbi:hypothetical protein BS78_K168800 [Paspalum vaginatum]|uniref:Uncharacterized protein n=1 Tax=Paspalum vaginatum TaxID=158149 RepID=A0A9W7XBQ6_9POAL|nr:hypothetical protein BS78_K168800 [Paspalum vaginatum]